jgi:hypothetical protein
MDLKELDPIFRHRPIVPPGALARAGAEFDIVGVRLDKTQNGERLFFDIEVRDYLVLKKPDPESAGAPALSVLKPAPGRITRATIIFSGNEHRQKIADFFKDGGDVLTNCLIVEGRSSGECLIVGF